MKHLVEDIEAVKKYYPNIDDTTFRELIELDPTYRNGSNSLGKYGKWILNLYKNNNISEDDFEDVTKILNQFNIYRNRIQNKDLNFYKTLDDLSDVLAHVVDDDSMLSDRQKVRFKKNVKAGRIKVDAEDDYDVVLETPKYIVYVPNTHEASMKLGKGTRWCTAHENPEYYNDYTENGSKLYIVKNKFTNEMWQFHDAYGEFLDENDDDFEVVKLLDSDSKLKEFFMKLIGFVGNGEFIYMGAAVPYELKDEVITLKVADGVKYIKDYSFCNCKNLVSVEISGSVKEVGDCAFTKCKNLATVIINEGVEVLGEDSFRGCKSLRNLQLSNSVSVIGDGAFCRCNSLVSVTIPGSVLHLRRSSFRDCESLETVDILDGVVEVPAYVFRGCMSLKSVKIPDSVAEVSSYAFMEVPDDQLTIYTDNEIVKSDLEKFTLFTIKPERMFKGVSESLKLRIKERTNCNIPIFEKLNRLGSDMFITDYVGNIVDLVKNKTDTYRILYDSKIDKYIIASSYDYTHFEMLKKAHDEGYYIDIEDYIDNVSDGLHSYFHDGVYGDSNDKDRAIVCYLVYPDSNTKWLYNDSYDSGYLLNTDDFRFQNGAGVVVGIKGNAFADKQFFKALGEPRILSKKELAESVVNSEYLSEDTACIASKTSYMNEDGLDANGIYYFGDKPKLPMNWKDYKSKKLKIKEKDK